MKKIKVGIVGCGSLSQYCYLPFFTKHRGVEVVVSDAFPERLDEVAGKFKNVKAAYGDYRTMFKSEKLDAVCVCTPNYLHAPITIAAAAHGAHVMCEKPMALSVKEGEAMVGACKRHSVLLMIDFTHRFYKGTQKVKQLLDEGRIGNPHSIRIRYVHGGPYPGWAKSDWFYSPVQAGGGALMDMGVHAIDTSQYLFGPIREISASLKTLAHEIAVEDSAMMMAEFDGGRRALLETGWTGASGFTGIEVCGSNGNIVMNLAKGLYLTTGKSKAGGPVIFEEKQVACEITGGGYGAAFKEFLNHIENRTQPECDGAAGLAAIKVLEAAYKSNKTGRRIAIK